MLQAKSLNNKRITYKSPIRVSVKGCSTPIHAFNYYWTKSLSFAVKVKHFLEIKLVLIL